MTGLGSRLASGLRLSATEPRIAWPDLALAFAATAVTVYWLVQRADYWALPALWLSVLVSWSPLLIAIRRIDPVLALVGMLGGAYLWTLLAGGVPWPLLAGCLLAVGSLPTRRSTGIGAVLVALLAAVPLVLGLLREDLPARVSTRFLTGDGRFTTFGGIAVTAWNRAEGSGWPWWFFAIIVFFAVVALVVRLVAPVRRTTGKRVEELLGAVRHRSDLLLAVGLTTPVLVELWWDRVVGNWWSAPGWMPYAVAFAPLTLVVRRRWPAVPAVVLGLAALVSYWQTDELWTALFAFAVALYSLGTARPSLLWSVPTAVAVLAALPAIAALIRYPQLTLIFPKVGEQSFIFDGVLRNTIYDEMVDRQWPISLSLTLLVPVCAGIAVRLYRRTRAAARREAELEQETVALEAEQVLLTERSHIARDLHDVVAHAVNLMVIQAETGPDLMRRGEADVLQGFQRIGDAGRRALGELDRLLSALRDADGVPDPQLTPQPGLAELPQLVADVSNERLTVELDLRGDRDGPPVGHQLTAYRLVQEALTNAVRHAKAESVQVLVDVGEAGIRVDVTDDGIGFDVAAAKDRGRHGLAGMRERVRIHGGLLDVRSAPGGGTTVSARIPVEVAE